MLAAAASIPAIMHATKKYSVKTFSAGIPRANAKNGKAIPMSTPKAAIHMAMSVNTRPVRRIPFPKKRVLGQAYSR